MKKFVFIVNALDILAGLLRGERFEGVLFWDKEAGRITFKAWNRNAPKNYKQKKICDLDGGWLGESEKHIVRHEKFAKNLGLANILTQMEHDHQQSTGALVERFVTESV